MSSRRYTNNYFNVKSVSVTEMCEYFQEKNPNHLCKIANEISEHIAKLNFYIAKLANVATIFLNKLTLQELTLKMSRRS